MLNDNKGSKDIKQGDMKKGDVQEEPPSGAEFDVKEPSNPRSRAKGSRQGTEQVQRP